MGNNILKKNAESGKQFQVKLSLFLYDAFIFIMIDILLFVLYQGGGRLSIRGVLEQSVIAFACIFGVRRAAQVYQQIWRYGGIQC